jgi:hypothetical protein
MLGLSPPERGYLRIAQCMNAAADQRAGLDNLNASPRFTQGCRRRKSRQPSADHNYVQDGPPKFPEPMHLL